MQVTAVLEPPVSAANRQGKYLTFHLGREEFGCPVQYVKEIMGVQDVTAVAQTPDFVKGAMNLRGKIIPVVDLRLKLGFPEAEYDASTCIIVVRVQIPDKTMQMGLIVDRVAEVLHLSADEIEDPPDFGEEIPTPYLLGIAKMKDSLKILLDIDQVLSTQELRGLESVSERALI